jgi:ubiquinone/menaquinone biosynthesis C-methylase UbiE
MKDILIRSYDRSAKDYDRRFYEQQKPKFDFVIQKLQDRKPGPLLDLGAGTGLLYQALQAALPPWAAQYQGLELSAGMVNQALSKGVPMEIGDMESLSFPMKSFAVVTAISCIGIMGNNWDAVLKQAKGVLHPTGLLIITSLPSNLPAELDRLIEKQGFVQKSKSKANNEIAFTFTLSAKS